MTVKRRVAGTNPNSTGTLPPARSCEHFKIPGGIPGKEQEERYLRKFSETKPLQENFNKRAKKKHR
jgi:hypothetical protein